MNPNPIPRTRERGPAALSQRTCIAMLHAIHARALAGDLDAMAAIVRLALGKLAASQERKVAKAA